MAATAKPLASEPHSAIHAGGSANPILLSDETVCHRVLSGSVDVFAVANSAPDSRRHYLFSLGEGAMLFALRRPADPHVGLLAVGSQDSAIEIRPSHAPLPDGAADRWIEAVAAATRAAPPRGRATALAPGLTACRAGDRLMGDARTLRWVQVLRGQAQVSETDLVLPEGVRLPLSGPLQLDAKTDLTIAVTDTGMLRAGDLAPFHRACQEALRLRFPGSGDGCGPVPPAALAVDPLDMTLRRMAGAGRGQTARLGGLGGVPLHAALGHIFDELGVARIRKVFDRDLASGEPVVDRLAAILAQHRLLSRTVLLRPGWDAREGPPLLAYAGAERRPVALVCRRRGWTMLDGDVVKPVDADLAAEAVQIYPTLPIEPFPFRTLFGFGLVGGRLDGVRLLVCLVAGAAFAALVPLASRTLIDDTLPHGDLGTAGLIVVGLFITVLARTIFDGVKGVALLRSELRLETRLQPALIARMMSLPTGFYRAHSVGDIMDRVLGIQRARQLISTHAGGAVVGAIFSLISLVPIVSIDWRFAAVTSVLACALGGGTAAIALAELRHERRRVAQKGKLDGFVLQILMGIAKLRAAAAEPRAFERWADLFRANLSHTIAAEGWANAQRSAQALLPELATIALYGAVVVVMKTDAEAAASGTAAAKASAKALSAGDFVALSASAAQVFGAITGLADALTRVLAAIPLVERSRPIIATELDVPKTDTEPLELAGRIDIRGLSFRYAASGPPALDGLDLTIEKGQFVAVVGTSGSGKSTLLRLLLGFERPERGDIFYDGVSMRRLAVSDLRRQMGVVLQHGKLFSGSVHHNIVGQSGLGLEEATAAARLVGLDSDIAAMPMGLHTVLLDGGATLSGGQRQRILIARALVGRPSVLLLDEATSALDNRTQGIVTETLAKLAITRIVIAHRLSTIEAADRIVVLERGRLVETGTFTELMAAGGPFAAHARRQTA